MGQQAPNTGYKKFAGQLLFQVSLPIRDHLLRRYGVDESDFGHLQSVTTPVRALAQLRS